MYCQETYRLNTVDQLKTSDLFELFSLNSSTRRKVSLGILQEYLQDNLVFPTTTESKTQYYNPLITGFSVSVNNVQKNIWLLMRPNATMAAGTIVLPPMADLLDGQEIMILSTNAITTLSIDANGAVGIVGGPTTLAANGYFKLKYDVGTTTWYRIG